MSGWRYIVCPVEFNNDSNRFQVDCEPSELFQLQDYTLPSALESFTGWTTVRLYPFQIHSIALSSFASIMGPFGGFFASGFKRAFKIKDFANTIPVALWTGSTASTSWPHVLTSTLPASSGKHTAMVCSYVV
ncbi:Phosphatidate cytidylyltransferase 2 [Dissostichus eleginoides]|uniref:phosphatidate cytidylyltransferase n=1 Tax=Dissostichus eleginoides TaxID=100907 RepID=A0AAD9F8F9_DISEL|nr:Phosphatidate cytidylyltransferase 2 [Dissostichus eleginoides]